MADEAKRLELRAANLIALNHYAEAQEAMDAADEHANSANNAKSDPAPKAQPKGK